MQEIKIKKLRCNYLRNPLGTSLRKPRFSWMLLSNTPHTVQSAYQIQVALNPDFSTLLWDTGWVKSDDSIQINYQGPSLDSMTKYYWHVRIRDQHEVVCEWSKTRHWETGLKAIDWRSKWIEPEKEVDQKAFKPASYLRKCFEARKQIKSARLYITSHGLYEAYINGKRVGDQVFTPGNTSYTHRLQYQVYDVLDLLQAGENCIGVILGDGWYRGSINANSNRNSHGDKLALLSQIKILYEDGSHEWIYSDESWKANTGPILKSDWKDGEIYDARLEMDGWNKTGYDEGNWQPVLTTSFSFQNLIPSEGHPVRKMEAFNPVKIITTPKGETVIDFGQNFAGYAIMRVQGEAGTTVKLQYSETLDENGNFTLSYLGTGAGIPTLLQRDEYTLRGKGVEIYEPHFTVHGFRYIWVNGYPGELKAENFTACAIYSDMGESSKFECSNPKLNQLHQNVLWSQKSNFLDIPTDCPTRERAGWTGDAQIFVHAGSLLMNDAAFFSKWIKDVSAEQYKNGMIRNFVPAAPPDKSSRLMNMIEGSAGWGDAVVIIPWTLYQMFGDKTILEEEYESMKKWVEYERRNAQKTHWSKKIKPAYWLDGKRRAGQHYIWDTKYHWGEWLEPDIPLKAVAISLIKNIIFSNPIVASAYYANSCQLLAKIAKVLGKNKDADEYGALAEKCKHAYISEFINPDGSMKAYTDKQAPYVRALALGLYNETLRPKLEAKLVERVEKSNRHLGTGFLSTPFLCDVLSEIGRNDLAYAILQQEDHPSWLYAINHGATTIWEDWDGINEQGVPNASLNHYSKGAVVSWFYEYMCGIQLDPEKPAYKHFFLKPQPGGGLTYARASYESMYGEVKSGWEKIRQEIKYSFTIPANTHATVVLKNVKTFPHADEVVDFRLDGDLAQFDLPSGSYEFIVKEGSL